MAGKSKKQLLAEAPKLTPRDPQKDALTRHHMNILARGLQRENRPPLQRADNTTSTVLAGTFDFPDGVRMLPTFWDGVERSPQQSVKRARQQWGQWPVFQSREEAEAYYKRLKTQWK